MMHILFVKGLISEEDKNSINDILTMEEIKCTVSLANKSVTIYDRGDEVARAIRLIESLGYTIL